MSFDTLALPLEVPPMEVELSEAYIDAFERAAGLEMPLSTYSDPKTVIPSFPTCFRKGEFAILDAVGIELKKLLHAEQEYEFYDGYRRMRSCRSIKLVSRLTRVLSKKGSAGSLTFFTFESDIIDPVASNGAGEKLALSRTTLVLKEGPTS